MKFNEISKKPMHQLSIFEKQNGEGVNEDQNDASVCISNEIVVTANELTEEQCVYEFESNRNDNNHNDNNHNHNNHNHNKHNDNNHNNHHQSINNQYTGNQQYVII